MTSIRLKKAAALFLLTGCFVFLTTCRSAPFASKAARNTLRLTFAGDIMAHSINYNMRDFSLIYKDIESIIQNDDLTFANFETPVYEKKTYESYPTFNVQPAYALAAMQAGFDVFSLANNHTNDQGLEGIISTRAFFLQNNLKRSVEHAVFASGIKERAGDPLTYQMINVQGWKILFVAITELLNQNAHNAYIDYVPTTQTARDAFTEQIKTLKEQNPCDIFVLSVHSGEEEYIRTVAKARREYYHKLLDAGVDILWANHVHIAREWDVLGTEENNIAQKIVFYSAGNTISGQRARLNFTDPGSAREYTGDGLLFCVEIARNKKNTGKIQQNWKINSVDPVIITTFHDEKNNYVIKRLTDTFIADLHSKERKSEAEYFTKRKQLMESIQGNTLWK
jgi:poly-gamma-glutamate synthesis protein (capsule biosynthesis protein)